MTTTPFTLDPVPEIPLARAPLAKVLTQIQYSRTPDLITDAGEQRLAELLQRYPVRRQAMTLDIQVGPAPGVFEQKATPIRIFTEPSQTWQVTVGETSVALETTQYESRDDFCQRAHEVFAAVAQVGPPPVVDRVGLRYVDRLHGATLEHLDEYVNPRLRVLHGAVGQGLTVEYSASDTLIQVADDERLKVRSGLLPPGGVFDPVLQPLPEPSWVLDLDMFTTQSGFAFDPAVLNERLRRYADHIYAFFRWATTDAFQREFQDASEPRSGGRGS